MKAVVCEKWGHYREIGIQEIAPLTLLAGQVRIAVHYASAGFGQALIIAGSTSAVFGVPHPEFGEAVKALVQPAGPVDDPERFAADLLAWCRARLSPIKCPRSVDISYAPLPRSDAGKLLKREIRKAYCGGETRLV